MRPFRDALILTASSFDPTSQRTALKVSTYQCKHSVWQSCVEMGYFLIVYLDHVHSDAEVICTM